MRKRVSNRYAAAGFVSLAGSSKCFTKTVPEGKVHSLVGEKVIFSAGVLCAPSFGTATQRYLLAPSDHNGVLTVYGIKTGAGARVARFVNAPTCDNNAGGSGTIVVVRLNLKMRCAPSPPN